MSASAGHGGGGSTESSSTAAWICEICLDDPCEPVVTPCGHLYCWKCVYRWLENERDTCPTCKAGITRSKLVPIYSRGRARQAGDDEGVPARPSQPRTEAPSQGGDAWAAPQIQFGLCVC
jgi:E3 ubiquitin-protein ligase RNF5